MSHDPPSTPTAGPRATAEPEPVFNPWLVLYFAVQVIALVATTAALSGIGVWWWRSWVAVLSPYYYAGKSISVDIGVFVSSVAAILGVVALCAWAPEWWAALKRKAGVG